METRNSHHKMFALLFRGSAFRWGCDGPGSARQMAQVVLHHRMLIEPLERMGHRVDSFLSVSEWGQGGSNEVWKNKTRVPELRCSQQSRRHLFETLQIWHGPGLRHSIDHQASTQSQSFQFALNWFLGLPSVDQYDVLMITRNDLAILTPVSTWSCDLEGAFNFASTCESKAWHKWLCTSDVFMTVSRQHWKYFAEQVVGRHQPGVTELSQPSTGCFWEPPPKDPKKPFELILTGGHGCYTLLLKKLGSKNLQFCWHKPAHQIRDGRSIDYSLTTWRLECLDNEIERRCYKKDWLTDDAMQNWTRFHFPSKELTVMEKLPNSTERNWAKKTRKSAWKLIKIDRRIARVQKRR